MIVYIDLRKEDADGLGGDTLKKMGARRVSQGGNTFTVRVPYDVDMPDDYVHVNAYIDALTEVRIRPMRVRLVRQYMGLTPNTLWGSAATSEPARLSASERKERAQDWAAAVRQQALDARQDVVSTDEVKTLLALAAALEAWGDEG